MLETNPNDWPVMDGHFAPSMFVSYPRSAYLVRAREAAARLLAEIPELLSVHAFGSVLDVLYPAPLADIDLLLVLADGAPAAQVRKHAEEILAEFPGREDLPSWDLVLRSRAALEFELALELLLSVRSVRLGGSPIWEEPPPIPANRATAARLWREKRAELGYMLRELHCFLVNDELAMFQPDVARRVQKRVLRLGMLDALARFGCFSVAPERCAELASIAHPDLAPEIQGVADDLAAGDHSIAAIQRAVELCANVLAATALSSESAEHC